MAGEAMAWRGKGPKAGAPWDGQGEGAMTVGAMAWAGRPGVGAMGAGAAEGARWGPAAKWLETAAINC